MATSKKLFISNGVTVDAGWTNVIATSDDGVNWITIRKNNIVSVVPVYLEFPGQFYKHAEQARFHANFEHSGAFQADVQDVANQPTWNPVAQVETVTLTGTSGTADVTIAGATNLATFATDLDTTAANFVTANAAAYAVLGVILTAVDEDLIFTSATAGVPIGASLIANVSGDLDGTEAATTANQTLKQGLDQAILDINGWL